MNKTEKSKKLTREDKFKKIKKNIKGITLVALVVTIIVLLILAGVAINLSVGENGIIRRAQEAINLYKDAAKNEEQQLAGVFGKKFADYNGKLTLDGANIVNKYGEKIQLTGLVRNTIKYWFYSLQ